MRQILVDHARKRQAAKRGGGAFQVELSEALIATDSAADQVLEIDEAIRKLSQLDPRQAEVVVMCVFGGLTEEEIASVLKVSGRTVKRDWSMAKAWLRGVLSSASAKNDG
jgi:RNA polymerase sigma factor (TIGR02999 family)